MRAPRWLREWWALRGIPPMTGRWIRAMADDGLYELAMEEAEEEARRVEDGWQRLMRELFSDGEEWKRQG